MVTGRTAADVAESIRIRAEKIQRGISPTVAEIATLQKGMLTVETMNRIETATLELAELFNAMGYYNTPVTTKKWVYADTFRQSDLQRWIDNLNILRRAFFVKSGTPETPEPIPNWKELNDIEQILQDMDVMINDVKSNYRICGDYECGE